MNIPRSRAGFTLVEMMVASSMGAFIMAAIAAALIFCQRMYRLTMVEAESALALREMRDRLLFHAGPGSNNGLLTGKVRADSASITMDWDDPADGPNNIRLVWRTDDNADGSYFFNERLPHTPQNINWFKPGGFRLGNDWHFTVNLPSIRLALLDPITGETLETATINLPTELAKP